MNNSLLTRVKDKIYVLLCISFIFLGSYFQFNGLSHRLDSLDILFEKFNLYKQSFLIFFSSFLILCVLNKLKLLNPLSLIFLVFAGFIFLNKLHLLLWLVLILLCCFSFGILLASPLNLSKNEFLMNSFIGYSFLIMLLTIFINFPINNFFTYLILLVSPIIGSLFYYWGDINKFLKSNKDIIFLKLNFKIIDILILSIFSIYLFISLMPEIGHDSLATHLYIPSYVKNYGKWDFDFTSYVWAISPFSANYFYSFLYMFGGDLLTKFFLFIYLLTIFYIFYSSLEVIGIINYSRKIIILLLLSTSVFFLVTSSLYIDLPWLLSFILLFFLAVKIYFKKFNNYIIYLMAFSALAITTKQVSLIYFATFIILLLIFKFSFLKKIILDSLTNIYTLVLIFWLLSPYIHAYILTGNPTFPFFNNIFQSIYFSNEGFNNPNYNYRDVFRFIYDFTFHSNYFIEGGFGSSGFFWLFFFIPLILFYLFYKVNSFILFCFSYFILTMISVFYFQSYIRYILPLYFLIYMLFIYMVDVFENKNFPPLFTKVIKYLLYLTVFLNLIHLNASTNYGIINIDVIRDDQARQKYLEIFLPIQSTVNYINYYDANKNKRVLFLSEPQGANLSGKSLYLNWYNYSMLSEFISALHSDSLLNFYNDNHIDYIIYEKNFANNNFLYQTEVLNKEQIVYRIEKSLKQINNVRENLFIPKTQ